MRGHPRTAGDVLTELPTKLEAEREEGREKKNANYLPNPERTNCGMPRVKESPHIPLSHLKITQLSRCDTAQGN